MKTQFLPKTLMLVVVAISAWCSNLQAQNIKYTVLHDNPAGYKPKLNINLEFMQMDANFNNIMGISFNTGLWGTYGINEHLGAQFIARKSYMFLGKLANQNFAGYTEFQAGGYFLPIKSTKTKKIQVNLSSSRGTNKMGQTVETTKFIMVPGTRIRYSGFRAGAFYKRTGFDLHDLVKDIDNKLESANYTTSGAYAGLMYRKLTNLIINAEGYGERGFSGAGEFYLDVTFHAVNNFSRLPENTFATDKEYDDYIKANTKEAPIGARLGWQVYQIAPKSVTSKKFGLSGNAEVGYRPYLGVYVSCGVGITLIKK